VVFLEKFDYMFITVKEIPPILAQVSGFSVRMNLYLRKQCYSFIMFEVKKAPLLKLHEVEVYFVFFV
jgi:hypothetical protein